MITLLLHLLRLLPLLFGGHIHWRGQPLKTYETVVNLIGTTSTRSGLKVKARLDRRNCDTGESISD